MIQNPDIEKWLLLIIRSLINETFESDEEENKSLCQNIRILLDGKDYANCLLECEGYLKNHDSESFLIYTLSFCISILLVVLKKENDTIEDKYKDTIQKLSEKGQYEYFVKLLYSLIYDQNSSINPGDETEINDCYYYSLLAIIQLNKGNKKMADIFIDRALLLNPYCQFTLLLKAWCECERKLYSEALEKLQFILDRDPNHLFALSIAYYASLNLEKYSYAESYSYNAVILDQSDEKTWTYFLASLAYQKKWNRLLLFSKKCIMHLSQRSPDITLLTSLSFYKLGKLESAEHLINSIDETEMNDNIRKFKEILLKALLSYDIDDDEENDDDISFNDKDFIPSITLPPIHINAFQNNSSYDCETVSSPSKDLNEKVSKNSSVLRINTIPTEDNGTYHDLDYKSLLIKDRFGSESKILSMYSLSNYKRYSSRLVRRSARSLRREDIQDYLKSQNKKVSNKDDIYDNDDIFNDRKWHKELYQFVNCPIYTEEEMFLKCSIMKLFTDEFRNIALKDSKILIREKYFSIDKKTIRPSKKHPNFYFNNGITYCFIDNNDSKRQFIKATNAIFNNFSILFGNLLTPPSIIVNYLGETILCISTITENECFDFNAPSISNIIMSSLLTSRLNIINYKIESLLQSLDTNPKEEVLYIKNAESILPIESDSIEYTQAYKGKKTYLRHELVSVWNRRLCVNIETTKIFKSDDNMIIGSKEDIDACTNWLISQWIPSWASRLTFEEAISTHFDNHLHDSGINIRHLGIVSNHCKNDYIKKAIIEKCLARTIKTIYSEQLRLRREKNGNTVTSEVEIYNFTIALLNIIFKNKSKVWETFIIPLVHSKFPTINIAKDFKFENIEDIIISYFSLFCNITNILGLTWSDQLVNEILTNLSFFSEEKPFKIDHLISISPKFKISDCLLGEEGWRNRININQLPQLDYNNDNITSILKQLELLYGQNSDEVFHAKWTIMNDLYNKGYKDYISEIKMNKTMTYKYNHLIMLLMNVYKFPHLLSVENNSELDYLLTVAQNYFNGKGYIYSLILLNLSILSQSLKTRSRKSKILDTIPHDEMTLILKAWNHIESYQYENNYLQLFINIFDHYIQTIAPFYHMPSITVQLIKAFGENSIIMACYYLSLCFSHCKRTQFEIISNYIMWPKTALRIVQSNRKSTLLESQCWWLLGLLESNKDIKISHYKRCLKLLTYIASPKYSYDDFPFLKILYKDWKRSINPLLLIDFNTRWIEFLEKLDCNSYGSKVLLNELRCSTSAIELIHNNLTEESEYRKALESIILNYDLMLDVKESPKTLNLFGFALENEWIENTHQIFPGLLLRNVLVPNFNIQNVSWPLQYLRCQVTVLDGRFHGKGTITFNQSIRLLTFIDVLIVEFNSGVITGSKNKIFFIDGTSYEGELINGILHGKGTIITPSWIYNGEFRNNMKHGKGVLSSYESNEEVEGYWCFGQLVDNYDELIDKVVYHLIGYRNPSDLRTFLLNKRKKSEKSIKVMNDKYEDDNIDVKISLDLKENLYNSVGAFLFRDSSKLPEVCNITLTKSCFININGKTSMNLKETIVAVLLGEEKDDIVDNLNRNKDKLQEFLNFLPSKSFNSDTLGCLLFSNFSGQNLVLVVDKREEKKWLKYSIAAMGGEKILYNYIFLKQIKMLLKGRKKLTKENFLSICNELKDFSLTWKDQSFWRELFSEILSLPNNDISIYKQLVIASILMFSNDNEGSFKLALDQFCKLTESDVPKDILSNSLLVTTTISEYLLNTIKLTTFGNILGKCLEIIWNLPPECVKDTWWYSKENLQLLSKFSSYNSLTLYQRCISINFMINISLFGPDSSEIDLERMIEHNIWRKCKNFYNEAKNDIKLEFVIFDSIDKLLYSKNSTFMKKIIAIDGNQINKWKELSRSSHEVFVKNKLRNDQSYESYVEELRKLS